MGFLRISDHLSSPSITKIWLVCVVVTVATLARASAQEAPRDLLLPDQPDYASLSENGRQLFDGLTNNRRSPIETIIVRMRPIEEALANNRLSITIPGRAEHYDVRVKTIEYSDDRNYKVYGTVGKVCFPYCLLPAME